MLKFDQIQDKKKFQIHKIQNGSDKFEFGKNYIANQKIRAYNRQNTKTSGVSYSYLDEYFK